MRRFHSIQQQIGLCFVAFEEQLAFNDTDYTDANAKNDKTHSRQGCKISTTPSYCFIVDSW
ncbi:MAG: hypothetical protein FWH27_03420 [Planctomycetaceae bacterium]|nr:hypothetical protein [Planctomycetaceae bacterium]